jgi:hypothetical protein
MNAQNKFVKHREQFRSLYESGIDTYEIASRFGASVETVRRGIHAVGGKTFRRARKYFHNSSRERQLACAFGVLYNDMVWMWEKQKGFCLWCKAPLPIDVLQCVVDHIGGRKTHGQRSSVRGLCCSSGYCNRIAGMIERGQFIPEGLLEPFIRNVKQVIAMNKGDVLREEKQR